MDLILSVLLLRELGAVVGAGTRVLSPPPPAAPTAVCIALYWPSEGNSSLMIYREGEVREGWIVGGKGEEVVSGRRRRTISYSRDIQIIQKE